MNHPILMPAATNSGADPNVVKFLEQLLAGAKDGSIHSLGAITVSPMGQINCGYVGSNGSGSYVGCDTLKAMLLAQFTGSKIVRG